MKVYDFTNYKEFILSWVQRQKDLGQKMTFQELANKIGIQKTYLSKVLNGDAQLNTDQLYSLSRVIDLKEEEEFYFLLLLEYQRTGIEERSKKLFQQIQEIRQKKVSPKEYLKAKTLSLEEVQQHNEYYLDPWNQIIHMALTIPKFQKTPRELIKKLSLSEKEFFRRLTLLEKLDIIEVKNEKVKILKESLHLTRESSLFWPWHKLITSSSHERSRLNNSKNDLNFSVSFSSDKATYEKIKKKFLQFMTESQKDVLASPSKELFQLNFDLINWELN